MSACRQRCRKGQGVIKEPPSHSEVNGNRAVSSSPDHLQMSEKSRYWRYRPINAGRILQLTLCSCNAFVLQFKQPIIKLDFQINSLVPGIFNWMLVETVLLFSWGQQAVSICLCVISCAGNQTAYFHIKSLNSINIFQSSSFWVSEMLVKWRDKPRGFLFLVVFSSLILYVCCCCLMGLW